MTDTVVMLWLEAMGMTALLIAAVLLVRRPVAALLGARMAYALWLIPLLRLLLPPLPGDVRIVVAEPAAPTVAVEVGASMADANAAVPMVDWTNLLQLLPALWLAGFVAVLGVALYRHRNWLHAMLADATPLEPIGRVQLVMSAAVDGPVATGLVRPLVAVPKDFFARYSQAERRLAIEHELAHHRAGDLWANAAALVVLAAQWFNPLAWWGLAAFRFDQEAACDARILGAVAAPERPVQAHHYARAIAKSLAGPRLLLAAPMTSGREVKERLQMLTKEPQGGVRPIVGRMLLGGSAVAVLALTISTLPDEVVFAAEPAAAAPTAPVEQRVSRVVLVDANDDSAAPDADGKKREVRQIIIRDHADGAGKPRVMMFDGEEIPLPDGAEIARNVQLAMPFFGLDEDELRTTLAEQGIKGAKADAVISRLREKRAEAMRKQFSWAEGHAKFAEAQAKRAEAHAKRAAAFAIAPCPPGEGQRVRIDTLRSAGDDSPHVRMIGCNGAEISKEKQVEAMKKARDRLAAQKGGQGMGAEIRASVVADLDKAIAELEAQPDS